MKRPHFFGLTPMPPFRLLAFALLCWLATPGEAWAYIDGGSAHLVIQGLIAAAIGALYYLRNPREIWRAIKRRLFGDKD